MEINITKPVQVEAKELRMFVKCCDRFTAGIFDQFGEEIASQDDGYVPDFMPDDHYGDYIILNIDIDTGFVTNWKKPSAEQIQEFIAKCNGND